MKDRLGLGFRPSGDPLAIAGVTIYLPTRRACRLVLESFLDIIEGEAAVLPLLVSLNDVDADGFGVNIIPHTAAVTSFGALRPGDPVNLEVDMLARYVARILGQSNLGQSNLGQSTLGQTTAATGARGA